MGVSWCRGEAAKVSAKLDLPARRTTVDAMSPLSPLSPRRERDQIVVTLPDQRLVDGLREVAAGVQLRLWDLTAPVQDPADVTAVVVPYEGHAELGLLRDLPALRLVQTLTAGYDTVVPHLPPGVALANAAGVHDASTAELAVGLAVAALRGVPQMVRDQEQALWRHEQRRSLADLRVLIVGYGGVGRAVAARMLSFETDVTAVASRARATGLDGVVVHGVEELGKLLPGHDVVVLTVPLNEATRGLVDAEFLAAMPDGALLVNVSRGPVVDTVALVAQLRAGRLLAALDVTDPEPLPSSHELWRLPGVLISPHLGGATSAMWPRVLTRLGDQLRRLSAGERLRAIIVPTPWSNSMVERPVRKANGPS